MKNRKKYIIFGGTQGIGGFQLYTAARFCHLKSLSYDTYVFDMGGNVNGIKILDLKKENCFFVREFCIPPYCLNRSQIEKVAQKVKYNIEYTKGDEIFIEACSLPYALWGEVLSEAMEGVCFAYILSSHTENVPRDLQKFCSFKYDQHLLAGQTDITLPDLFNGYRNVDEDKRGLLASWPRPICDNREDCTDIINTLILYKEEGYKVIGYFGTLNKPHFVKICRQVESYVRKHKNKLFLFVSIGSSFDKKSEKEQYKIKHNCHNCEVLNIPELYPVPKTLLEPIDVCLGSWGSASVAALGCKRVIRLMDDVEVVPQGIIGITLRKTPYYKLPVGKESLEQLLDNVLWGDNYKDVGYEEPVYIDKNDSQQVVIDNFMKPFKHNLNDVDYYNVSQIMPNSLSRGLMGISTRVLGVNMTLCLRKLAKKIFGTVDSIRKQYFRNK